MRITVDIDDELLRAVKAYAAGERMTLNAAIERVLREFLAGLPAGKAEALPIPVFGGQGVQPGVNLADSAAFLDIMEGKS